MSLSSKLKDLRVRSGESLQQVADAVNSSKAHIWELETGKNKNPSVDSLSKIADHFNVSVSYLIGEDPSSPDEEPELVAMYRNLKSLTQSDRETINDLIKVFKERKKGGGDKNK